MGAFLFKRVTLLVNTMYPNRISIVFIIQSSAFGITLKKANIFTAFYKVINSNTGMGFCDAGHAGLLFCTGYE
jgi:hypothetical protein